VDVFRKQGGLYSNFPGDKKGSLLLLKEADCRDRGGKFRVAGEAEISSNKKNGSPLEE